MYILPLRIVVVVIVLGCWLFCFISFCFVKLYFFIFIIIFNCVIFSSCLLRQMKMDKNLFCFFILILIFAKLFSFVVVSSSNSDPYVIYNSLNIMLQKLVSRLTIVYNSSRTVVLERHLYECSFTLKKWNFYVKLSL